ncbi:hypothetical protein V5799_012807 [Amblyomma americanum]|uniref:Uncharacterized protein n=1 Tax=Amblyomma americanum TaxID=6943 RepID=A0AAQ4E7M4_AMBAM
MTSGPATSMLRRRGDKDEAASKTPETATTTARGVAPLAAGASALPKSRKEEPGEQTRGTCKMFPTTGQPTSSASAIHSPALHRCNSISNPPPRVLIQLSILTPIHKCVRT